MAPGKALEPSIASETPFILQVIGLALRSGMAAYQPTFFVVLRRSKAVPKTRRSRLTVLGWLASSSLAASQRLSLLSGEPEWLGPPRRRSARVSSLSRQSQPV